MSSSDYLEADAKDLLDANIRLSPEEFSHYNQNGVLLADGSGYLATPTAYHNLHCLRLLHKTVYPDYYFTDDTKEEQRTRDAHASTKFVCEVEN